MSSSTPEQAKFMRMSEHASGRKWLRAHGKKPAPMSVAKEFVAADKGRRVGKTLKRR